MQPFSPPSSCTAPRARVLVVDDHPLLLTYAMRALEEHDVEGVRSAESALARVRAGERYDLIVCDVDMPGLGGHELHAVLWFDAPEQANRMLFTYGAIPEDAIGYLFEVQNPKLEKPFAPDTLRAVVAARLRALAADASPRAGVSRTQKAWA
jgi:CheY-like chemotaxis protein